ncbi:MAG: 50S ribosomal protein L29 [Alphaproteobacteria bacterium]|nr:50S ribosomal protein L29 [Alphaproteobacteria bacterium]OIN85986.1 MAG: 50S ribosomal protein L29 [Alphaproteobacteria bacterium CG1_02_46_17]
MAKAKTTNKAEDLKGKSQDELNAMLLDLRKQQMDMRFQQAGGQLQNTADIRKVRRTIARVKTCMSQQQAAQAAK